MTERGRCYPMLVKDLNDAMSRCFNHELYGTPKDFSCLEVLKIKNTLPEYSRFVDDSINPNEMKNREALILQKSPSHNNAAETILFCFQIFFLCKCPYLKQQKNLSQLGFFSAKNKAHVKMIYF